MKNCIFVAVLLALWTTAAFPQPAAQQPAACPEAAAEKPGPAGTAAPAERERRSDPQMEELIQSVMAAKLSKELGLNDEQTVLMVRRFSEYREKDRELKRQRQEKIKALKTALRDEQPEDVINTALQDLVSHDLQTLEFRKQSFQKAADNLSVTQKAKFYIFITDFDGDMRRLIQKAREQKTGHSHPHPPVEGPPPPPPAPPTSTPES